jgi:putative endonuclease
MYFVYITTNSAGSVLYTGMTNDLRARAYEHREKLVPGFTSRYNVTRLVYFETFDDVLRAIAREKQIKAGPRWKKVALVKSQNPEWRDLYDDIV